MIFEVLQRIDETPIATTVEGERLSTDERSVAVWSGEETPVPIAIYPLEGLIYIKPR